MEVPEALTGRKVLIIALLLVVIGICWRLIPHFPNFAPIGAIALTAGTLLSKRHALLLVLAVMLITDSIIGFYSGFVWTWLGLALIIPIGHGVKKLPFTSKTMVGALGASIVFFIVSNFGVWLTSGMYAPTVAGLINCYVMAIPFFGNTLVSDFLFSAALLGFAYYSLWHGHAQIRLNIPGVTARSRFSGLYHQTQME